MSANKSTFSRRRLMLGGALALPAAAWLARPAERAAPHPEYFQQLSGALREAGIAQACLVLDLSRARANIAAIGEHHTKTGMSMRAVLKSLPCLSLMDEVAQGWKSSKIMAFNAAQLTQYLQARPQAQALLGKPLPVQAAAKVLETLPPNISQGIEWLVDTPARLAEYRQLAQQRGQTLRINLEVDVGLHRGGFEDKALVAEAMKAIVQPGGGLRWQGLMGYDAHVAFIPTALGLQQSAWDESQRRYKAYWDAAQAVMKDAGQASALQGLTLNTAGSPTFRMHDGKGVANEVSVGSAVVKPSDFERPLLADLQAAMFIATPVLKTMHPFRMPEGALFVGQAAQLWDRNQREGLAIHGGHWMADVASPPGLAPSGLYGHSSNQQMMVTSSLGDLKVGDYVFLRPQQSEALMLQFGDLAVFDGQHISQRWPVLPASA